MSSLPTTLGAAGWSGEKQMHRVACVESCRAVDTAVYAVYKEVAGPRVTS